MRRMRTSTAGIACTTLLATAAQAQTPPAQPLWEAGIFGVAASQQAYPGAKHRVNSGIPLPFLVYRGEVVRAEQGSVGVRAVKTANSEVDIGVSGSFGSASNDNDARRGMPNIGTLVEFGPRLKWDLGDAPGDGRWRLALPLRGVFDINHAFDFRGVAFEPEFGWGARSSDGWGHGVSLGLLLGNARLADTFYGVAPEFVTAARPAYTARSGLISTRITASLTKRLSTDWRFFGFARVDSVAGAANRDSPLVERTNGVSVGLGLAWTWARSERSARE